MNKPRRFHFVSFSFQTFSTKLMSINNKKTVKNRLIILKNEKTNNNNRRKCTAFWESDDPSVVRSHRQIKKLIGIFSVVFCEDEAAGFATYQSLAIIGEIGNKLGTLRFFQQWKANVGFGNWVRHGGRGD